jgi:hypothetical protein
MRDIQRLPDLNCIRGRPDGDSGGEILGHHGFFKCLGEIFICRPAGRCGRGGCRPPSRCPLRRSMNGSFRRLPRADSRSRAIRIRSLHGESSFVSCKKQLVCYCRISRIAEVDQVVFVRKRMVEVQYLRTSTADQQGEEFGQVRISWKMGGIVRAGFRELKSSAVEA